MVNLGAGVSSVIGPIPRPNWPAQQRPPAIERAETDGKMRQRAARPGAVIQFKDGIARAVEKIGPMEGRSAV